MIDFASVTSLAIPEGNVVQIAAADGTVLWAAATGNIPAAYQEVEWIRADKDVKAYINLGFTFDTAATIYIEQFLENAPQWLSSGEETYPFGAADSTGIYRCMLTSPGNAFGTFIYGSDGTKYLSSYGKGIYQGKNRLKLIYKKGDFHWENLDTGEVSGKNAASVNIEYTMTDNLYLLGQNYKGAARFNSTKGHERCVGRFSYYDKNNALICDLYPCYRKSDGVIGMYDKVRNLFLTSAGSGSFTKGPDVVEKVESYTNLAEPTSTDWLTDYRLSSSSGNPSQGITSHKVTNFIPAKMGDTLRVKGLAIDKYISGYSTGVWMYKADKAYQNFAYTGINGSTSGDGAKDQLAVDGDISTYTILMKDNYGQQATSDTAYIRIDGVLLEGYGDNDVIITINEEIPK